MHDRYSGSLISYIFLLSYLLISTSSAQEQLTLAAIRVEFQADQNELTTGTGKFILAADDVPAYTVDPPPHNRSYFQDQIIAVRNYFNSASHQQLQISGEVFPREQENAYQLPQQMAYYNPNTTDEENNARLAELFVNAIETADQDPNLDFSQFDLVVIFHAGVGKDIDLGFDETPQDIPSLYISPDFLQKYLGASFTGVEVDNGSISINRAIILPETESQDGIQAALTGIFAANIGSHLGLYDLFNPSDGSPGIGSFGLMDNGLFNVFGLVPAMPCALSRIRAGWETSQVLTDPAEYLPLHRVGSLPPPGPAIYQIPINSDEYYLLEYRGNPDIKIDSVYNVLANTRDEIPSYLEVLNTYLAEHIEISDSTGVLLKIEDYDWGLPGSGILIWHIDESVIAAKGALNQINDNPSWRAVDLEEADGSQDIGYSYTFFDAGYQSEFGTWLDFWFEGNPAPLYKNEFSSKTSPNSRSNRDFAYSHITLNNFSSNSNDIMTFSYARDFYLKGFPVQLDQQLAVKHYFPLGSISISGTANKFLVSAAASGEIFMISGDGEGVMNPSDFTAAVFGQTELPAVAAADTNQDDQTDLLVAVGKSGRVVIFTLGDSDNNDLLDTLSTTTLQDSITTPPVFRSPYFFIGTKSNNVYRFDINGTVDSVYSYDNPVNGIAVGPDLSVYTSQSFSGVTIIDSDSDGLFEIVTWDGGNRLIISGMEGEIEKIITLPEYAITSPVFADVDQNGYYDIIFSTAKKVFSTNFMGTPLPNMPVVIPGAADDMLIASPIVADINDDGISDLLVSTRNGLVYGLTNDGKVINGFPFTIGGEVENTVTVADLNGDDQIELFAINKNGSINAWKISSAVSVDEQSWFQPTYNSYNNRFVNKRLAPVQVEIESLLPAKQVFNYPNPNTGDFTNIRYYLRDEAKVTVRIFDIAGDLVTSFTGPGFGRSYNEIRWNVADISSGVYLCRIEAISANDTDVRIIKIMVVN